MIDDQGAFADDAHADQHHDDGQQDAEEAERTVDEQHAEAGARPTAEVLGRDAQRLALRSRELQAALVGRPAEIGEADGRSGEKSDESQQQPRDPAGAVAVGPLHLLAVVRSVFI